MDWEIHTKVLKMELIAGLLGIIQFFDRVGKPRTTDCVQFAQFEGGGDTGKLASSSVYHDTGEGMRIYELLVIIGLMKNWPATL